MAGGGGKRGAFCSLAIILGSAWFGSSSTADGEERGGRDLRPRGGGAAVLMLRKESTNPSAAGALLYALIDSPRQGGRGSLGSWEVCLFFALFVVCLVFRGFVYRGGSGESGSCVAIKLPGVLRKRLPPFPWCPSPSPSSPNT